MLSEESFQRLVLKTHEAATNPSQWDALVKSVADAFNASSALLMTPGEADTHERFLWSNYGLDPQNQAEYGSHWAPEDPWLLTAQKKHMSMSRGVLHIGESYLPKADLHQTAFYNEFAVPTGIEGVATLIIEESGRDKTVPMPTTPVLRCKVHAAPEIEEVHFAHVDREASHFAVSRIVICPRARHRARRSAVGRVLDADTDPDRLACERVVNDFTTSLLQ